VIKTTDNAQYLERVEVCSEWLSQIFELFILMSTILPKIILLSFRSKLYFKLLMLLTQEIKAWRF
jgi:hypothetical protein